MVWYADKESENLHSSKKVKERSRKVKEIKALQFSSWQNLSDKKNAVLLVIPSDDPHLVDKFCSISSKYQYN